MNDPLTLSQTLFLVLFGGLSFSGFFQEKLLFFSIIGGMALTLFSLTLGGGLETAFLAVLGMVIVIMAWVDL